MQDEYTIKDLRGILHTVRRCKKEDVSHHFNAVKHLVPKEDHAEYQTSMYLCVSSGMAFCVNDCCFIYTKYSNKSTLEAFSLYGKNQPLKTLAMFACILMEVDKSIKFLKFQPHYNTSINSFKTLLSSTSLLRRQYLDKPTVVRCDLLRDKLYAFYIRVDL